jgi:hypothetical protein
MKHGQVSAANRPPAIECPAGLPLTGAGEGVVGSEETIMLDSNEAPASKRDPWNKGRLIGQKRPLKSYGQKLVTG